MHNLIYTQISSRMQFSMQDTPFHHAMVLLTNQNTQGKPVTWDNSVYVISLQAQNSCSRRLLFAWSFKHLLVNIPVHTENKWQLTKPLHWKPSHAETPLSAWMHSPFIQNTTWRCHAKDWGIPRKWPELVSRRPTKEPQIHLWILHHQHLLSVQKHHLLTM